MSREEKTYTILPIKLSVSISDVIDSYCGYRACQKKSFETVEGKRFVLGGGQSEELQNSLDECNPKYREFSGLALADCIKLQNLNGFPEYASVIRGECEEDNIYFNNAAASYGRPYKTNEEILTFLLLNSEKNAQKEALSETNYQPNDAVYNAILKETLTKLESSIGSVDIWEYPY